MVVTSHLRVAVSRLLNDVEGLARIGVLHQLLGSGLRVLVYLRKEAEPQGGHLLVLERMGLELRQLDEYHVHVLDDMVGILELHQAIIVVPLLGVVKEGLVDEVERVDRLEVGIVLAVLELLDVRL